jgi:uncharacterized protein (TIGR03067 family)
MSALVAALLLVPTGAPEKELSEAAKKEVKRLEGEWKPVKIVVDGNDVDPKRNGEEQVAEFKGRTFLVSGKELFEVAALDPTAKPKSLDFKALADLDEIAKGNTYQGIYKLDGDSLELALHLGDGTRPTTFEPGKEAQDVVISFKREKK